ncbi:MAG: VacJ family lipoprotein [Hyphomicrobiales bacterium]
MTNFTKSACIVSKKIIGPVLIACALAGCSVTANNSALLLDTSSKISVVEIPRVNPTRDTNSLPSSKSVFAQTVKSPPEAEQVIEEDALLNDSVVEAKDPNENFNRKVHGFNFGVDKVIIRPLSKVYGTVVPPLFRLVIKNGLRHLEIPGDLINYTLQGNGKEAGTTLKRFFINSTLGIGGAFDIAGELGHSYNPTDFGLTLADWGVGEGRYLVTPIFGPGTVRDAFGRIVDIGLKPQTYIGVITDFNYGGLISNGVETIDKRHRNGDLLDNVIISSPDPYVTLRSIYLQRRRALASDNIIGADGMLDALPAIATAGE